MTWGPEIYECRPFTDEEKDLAKRIGTAMHLDAINNKDSVYEKSEEENLEKHIIGATGELAWSIATGMHWPMRIGSYKKYPDFDPDIEIRLGNQGYPNMVIRPREMELIPQRRFVAGVHHPDDIIAFHGWAYGYEFRDYPLTDIGNKKKPAHFIHISDLHRFPFHEPQGGFWS